MSFASTRGERHDAASFGDRDKLLAFRIPIHSLDGRARTLPLRLHRRVTVCVAHMWLSDFDQHKIPPPPPKALSLPPIPLVGLVDSTKKELVLVQGPKEFVSRARFDAQLCDTPG